MFMSTAHRAKRTKKKAKAKKSKKQEEKKKKNGKQNEAAGKKIVIVCAKPYEFEAMNKALNDKGELFIRDEASIGKRFNVGYRKDKKTDRFFRYEFHMTKKHVEHTITVTRFIGNVQGPVECGIHVSQVIAALEPDYIGMIGVCGGHRLGEVVMAAKAVDARAGRMVSTGSGGEKIDRSAYDKEEFRMCTKDYYFQSAKDNTSYQNACTDVADHQVVSFKMPGMLTVHKDGVLYTYPQVREDCTALVGEKDGLDMEAFAFFKAVRMAQGDSDTRDAMSKVKALPVIKAVSDASQLKDEKTGNKAFDKRRKANKKHNSKVMDSARVDAPTAAAATDARETHKDQRNVFRPIAARKAADVMAAYLETAHFLD
ncbi:hypothetical protein PTSG_06833 [Salpingoeca rosetta]|uniref:Nucleoside phosphorylase domain-containing protein n=1 Tax=Salpingoeca rosetta (strain ATCC 50818 / BSB-021) TaxID=946362 RepID=F2UEY0_SALR5|nr:uncharacterized protein PTSG_06833 [Salpingoeca rosetta]EGD75180.1 hypothetical protein PTSG_06833 [Salpingoeca rosetta]|eukprot:XP_004992233.1 hypothetical protein PTSG_06833 [Salpingoeca rosetta]